MITQYRPAYYDNPRASTLSGLSTDQKPTDVENGARYEEIDTGKTFCFDKENKAWYEMPQSGGGGSSVSVEPITITKNGVTTAPEGVAYSPITTNVPAPVTSVNGKTGDVKTGMVINFTLDTSQSENITSDVPFADALAFINENPTAYIQVHFDNDGEIWTFNQAQISYTGAILLCSSIPEEPYYLGTGLGMIAKWTSEKIEAYSISSASPIVLKYGVTTSVVRPGGFDVMTIINIGVTYHIPMILLLENTEFKFICVTSDDKLLFATDFMEGVRATLTGEENPSEGTVAWTVGEEQIIKNTHIVEFNSSTNKGNASFADMQAWYNKSDAILLRYGNRFMQIGSDSDSVTSDHITFEYTSIKELGFEKSKAICKSDNTWTTDSVVSEGFEYKSPSGKKFTISVADDGTLSTKEVTA